MTTQDVSPTTEDASQGPGRRRVERYDPSSIEPRWQRRWD